MINWLASRIHAASLEANYDWITIEMRDGTWEVHSTEKEDIRHFTTLDGVEVFLDRYCARLAAIHVLCFWRKNP